jgi:hypothetical protein
MAKKKPEIPMMSIDIIEKAKSYSVLSKTYIQKAIHIGNRAKLARLLLNVPVDMVIATTGTKERCIILLDYKLGDLMELIVRAKEPN